MAAGFGSSSASSLVRNGVWDYNAPYTVSFWAKITTDRNADTTFFSIGANIWPQIEALQTDSDGTTLKLQYANGDWGEAAGTSLTVNVWNRISIVRTSATELLCYLNGVLDITLATSDVSARAASATVNWGNWWVGDGAYLVGNIAAVKVWTAALTAAELSAEVETVIPRRTTNLWGWYPLLPGATERLIDYSANGRSLTASGTITDTDSPPLTWGAPVWMVGLGAPPPSGSIIPLIASYNRRRRA